MTVVFTKKAPILRDRPFTYDSDELEKLNEQIRELNAVAPDTAPSFVAKDKIAFMSSDNIIMVYQVFEPEYGEPIKGIIKNPVTKQLFNVT